MLSITNYEVVGWQHAIRGMRNPKNSWDRLDSGVVSEFHEAEYVNGCLEEPYTSEEFVIGENDHKLMMQLASGGPVHAKYRRMIVVYADVNAPLYWWKEADTYKVGTVANSCSTMHKIQAKEFEPSDFSIEHLTEESLACMNTTLAFLNENRRRFLKTKSKEAWWQMIQLLPSSYNQKRTLMLNYEVLHNMYHSRKAHKLDEWHTFCEWVEKLPYSELITSE